ncbi:hypothetical protein KVT40_005634 [Elsinoe batatas]|uniref:Uncharacterized protein n=1 Tax=Elsinoe batatas TaxID=2601811 RepID=A0A8K0KZ68_9PEZI|nr:hypothetical protein KVT40_005634 [Elsinoe batatas]
MHKPAWTLTRGRISRLLVVVLNLGRSCIVNLTGTGQRRSRSCDITQTGPTVRFNTPGNERWTGGRQ